MDITFTGNGNVKILMKHYLEENISSIREDIGMKANTSAKGDLF